MHPDPDATTPDIDVDEIIHRREDAGQPAAMPPDSLEDFEKAIRGDDGPPAGPHVPPANPD